MLNYINKKMSSFYPKDYKRIILNDCLVKKNRRILICSLCTKIVNCDHNKKYYLCTSADNWANIKKKYKSKFFGNYRLKIYLKNTIHN